MQKPSPNRFAAVTCVLLIAGAMIPPRISVTITPSLESRIFILDRYPTQDRIQHNRHILFNLPEHVIKDFEIKDLKTRRVIKKVACAEGDTLTVEGLYYYCNGQYLGVAKERTIDGKLLDHFVYSGIIPEGQIFVFSPSKDSFDSKYYGFMEEKDVLAIAHPVF